MLSSEKGPRMSEVCSMVNGGLFTYSDEGLQSLGTLFVDCIRGRLIYRTQPHPQHVLKFPSYLPTVRMSSFLSCHSYCLHSETTAAPPQHHGSDSWM